MLKDISVTFTSEICMVILLVLLIIGNLKNKGEIASIAMTIHQLH